MSFRDKKSTFIQRWGELAPKWGINKTMGQIHALLLISPKPYCSDEIMEVLDISRGNTCMNLKALVEWGLAYKHCKEGCRKEYYLAEKDMYKVFRQIVIHRRKEELEPLLEMMTYYDDIEENCPDSSEFCRVLKDIKFFSRKADATLDSLLKTNPDWFVTSFLRMIR
ncbi:MAG: ArsR family transcriptional regulator [Saprospiraceae bacterium]|nr:ArsR family transcriptional regulator [Saprospiraceae bacterium]